MTGRLWWLFAFCVGGIIGVLAGRSMTGERPASKCVLASVPLTIDALPSPATLPAGTQFRLGQIGDSTEAFLFVTLPSGLDVKDCGADARPLNALVLPP